LLVYFVIISFMYNFNYNDGLYYFNTNTKRKILIIKQHICGPNFDSVV